MVRHRHVKLRTHLHLVQKLRMGGAKLLTYHTLSWRARDLYKEGAFSTISFTIPNFYFSNLTMHVEGDFRKLDVKLWRRKALDREEWASIVREAKAKLKGP